MPQLDALRKKIEEKKSQPFSKKEEETKEASIDIDEVENIVKQMKKKYKEQGIAFEDTEEDLSALRGVITGTQGPQVTTQPIEELAEFQSPVISRLGQFFLTFELLLSPVMKGVKRFPVSKELSYMLYSANMNYSPQQYIALSIAASTMVFVLMMILGLIGSIIVGFRLEFAFLLGLGGFLFTLMIILIIPKSIAQKRGDQVSTELPFALRHISTELRAGLGLYKTLQTVAAADYGLLSEEFSRTITEIEEGTDTQQALRHFALRTQSRALRSALLHIIRALKTGGNLSQMMSEIAEDVSFELRLRISDFAEKMNFFGVIFIFGAIVVPVFIAILGSVANAPLGSVSLTSAINLPPKMILIFYAAIMPLLLGMLVFYLKINQPKV
ncbi:MAG: type II secretion system F family protein [Candidatus Moranbacteria bacterium]|nr:type II secretion system F family protein [Candidatus Moranbacteria bacterium]